MSRRAVLYRIGSTALFTIALGAPAMFAVTQLLVHFDGASIDAGETVNYLMPLPNGEHVWQGTFVVQEKRPDGKFVIHRTSDPKISFVVERKELAPIDRWRAVTGFCHFPRRLA
jgi:hypothetical protein